MEPVQFGSSAAPLFGIYHPPQTGYSTVAYVLCNPLGQEAIRVYRFYREIALRLGQAGVHVFRFDYSGCGNSFGTDADYSVQQWMTDIKTAATELYDIAGVDEIRFIGVRFGASLALLNFLNSGTSGRIIAVDPIVDGTNFVSDLRSAHATMCADTDRFRVPRRLEESPGDFLGFHLSDSFIAELEGISLFGSASTNGVRIDLITSQETADYRKLRDFLANLDGTAVSLSCIDFQPDWDDGTHLERTLIVPNLVDEICRLATL